MDLSATPVSTAIERHARALADLATRPPRALDRIARRPGVTVIVPIFNAAAALARCLETLAAAGDPCELILVDDHSSEAAIGDVCASFARRWPRTRVLRNDRNLGFVSTVNRGMREAAAGNDVVLLNSDTEVSAGWLRRLAVAAHLDERTATACPLSNAAGVFSVPVPHEDDDLPAGLDVAACQRALALVSERVHEQVPSTSGFCMLIRRTALARVGLFDSGLFLRGYGEENDFNERALGAGFHHVIEDGSFVFHKRGLSFGAAREQLKRANARILAALHPGYADRARAWEARSQLAAIGARYGELVRWAATQPGVLAPVPIRLDLAARPIAGGWHDAARTIGVTSRGDDHEVDLFGVARAEVRGVALPQLVFELGQRWDVGAVAAVDDPGLATVARPATSALGLPA